MEEDMIFNEMRRTWNETSERMNRAGADMPLDGGNRRRHTALQKLAERYRRFAIFGLMMMGTVTLMTTGRIMPGEHRLMMLVAFAIYFATASLIDFNLYRKVKKIDCWRMSVREVNDLALSCRKRHLQYMAVLIPMAIVLIGLFAYSCGADRYVLAGLFSGIVIGLLVGYRYFREFMNNYKTFRD